MEFPGQISWLDYIIANNPNGLMRVLVDYGFTGYMAPQSEAEMRENAIEIIHLDGNQGVINILKAHPEYGAFQDIFEKKSLVFKNATGENYDALSAWVYKRPINQLFVALSVFVIAYYIVTQIRKPV